jgi:hypothetical protein
LASNEVALATQCVEKMWNPSQARKVIVQVKTYQIVIVIGNKKKRGHKTSHHHHGCIHETKT